jgi:hypothetical protein
VLWILLTLAGVFAETALIVALGHQALARDEAAGDRPGRDL